MCRVFAIYMTTPSITSTEKIKDGYLEADGVTETYKWLDEKSQAIRIYEEQKQQEESRLAEQLREAEEAATRDREQTFSSVSP